MVEKTIEVKKKKELTAPKKKYLQHWEWIAIYMMIYDIIAFNFSYYLGLWVRFDLQFSKIPFEYFTAFLKFAPIYTVFALLTFYVLRLYKSIWRFASFDELTRIITASIITTIFQMVGITIFMKRMPITYYVIGALVQGCLVLIIRFGYRYVTLERSKKAKNASAAKNAMIIGGGEAGRIIIKELKSSVSTETIPCCIIDDNVNKWGRFIEGVQVVGGRSSINEMVKKYQIHQILLAMPSASVKERKDILDICKDTGCELKMLPGVYQMVNGDVSLGKMRKVNVEDLLGREPIKVQLDEIFQYIRGKTILVTGGGGSIGSELCRQIANHKPQHLIIFDIYENNAYEIEQELKHDYPKLKLSVLIGSVRDSKRINKVFELYRPDIVYHAAAHKHVPLMENSPNEAIKNNVIGTYKTARAALRYGAQRFVLISTDKAVNPTNIMGASKRLCEMVIQSLDVIGHNQRWDLLPQLDMHADNESDVNYCGGTRFVAVRFGNVLGSNGSVIPLFNKQIEQGGPVTVTHPNIVRYFMTIPEAVSLVLQAGTYAHGGEIFVLDMGAPVKIDTLARNLIRLSGYKPDDDIKVVYTGLRPGEKLFEEKLMAEEGMRKTKNELIHIGQPIAMDIDLFMKQLKDLAAACYENNDNIVNIVSDVVPTFVPVGANPTGKENIKRETVAG